MTRTRKIALTALAGTFGLLGANIAPASAATAGVAAFVGSATIGGGNGLWYPAIPGSVSRSGAGWTMAVTTGAAASSAPDAGTLTGTVTGGTLNDGLAGVGAFCGASGGSGGETTAGNELKFGASTVDLSSVGWAQSAASLIVFTGNATSGSESGTVVGIVSALPVPGGVGVNSCSNGTAADFTIVGAAATVTQ